MAPILDRLSKRFKTSQSGASTAAPTPASAPLCQTCSSLDVDKILRLGVRQQDSIALGPLTTILANASNSNSLCGFCALVSHLISRTWRLEQYPDEDLTHVQISLWADPCGWASVPSPPRLESAHRIRFLASPRPSAIHRMMTERSVYIPLELQVLEEDAARFGRRRAFHGRRVGEVVDVGLLREWLRVCEKEHGGDCEVVRGKNVSSGDWLPEGARMVDVNRMALVDAPRKGCRYVALSYLWGSAGGEYQTLLANFEQRRRKGGLESVNLPATITDAIKLVRLLKERYLWIDALCIIQDDPADKAVQIKGMHAIYGAAALTVFAAGGDSAHARLPGLEPGSRKKQQKIENIQSLLLAVPLATMAETVAASVWDTRGWTFQERLLSRRRLLFTNEQVYFECQREIFSEDVIAESCKASGTYPAKYAGRRTLQPTGAAGSEVRRMFYSRDFMVAVEEYTRRRLTNISDIYNAMWAIITVFSQDYEDEPLPPDTGFLFGMPLSFLESAMLWQPALEAPAHARRKVDGLVTPSWSWAGWEGGVAFMKMNGYMHGPPDAARSLVDEWVIGGPDGKARRISTQRHLQKSLISKETDKYHGPPPAAPPGETIIDEGEALAAGMLVFRTTSAFLTVRKINNQVDLVATSTKDRSEVFGSLHHSVFEILSSTEKRMGRIVLPADTDVSVPLEFVVLSRAESGFVEETYDYAEFGVGYVGCLLNVMVVGMAAMRDGAEISERVGVGVVVEAGWAAAGFRERVVRLQ
ncbi:heterokaryon incompatibility protein-domain-containing protein [Sphaerosporella brunnea]|uniref:Heterokaryon incompatibility protein-domain-containing protein n=1 Tax=Sphaerosporella brunnea TaxID=1250544 RepID=A0A5J5F5S6_9PEZI|nr:heterokaryon incompatibility protein-domain-containing protein [Sphaerosporella brunnea]